MLKKTLASPLIQITLLTALILAGMATPWTPWAYLENRNHDFWVGRRHHLENQPIAIVARQDNTI